MKRHSQLRIGQGVHVHMAGALREGTVVWFDDKTVVVDVVRDHRGSVETRTYRHADILSSEGARLVAVRELHIGDLVLLDDRERQIVGLQDGFHKSRRVIYADGDCAELNLVTRLRVRA
jgi:hypothetical protein